LESPAFICDLGALESNLRILADVQARSGCRILLALKAFAQWSTFDLVGRYLTGVAASSVNEARLGRQHIRGEVHAYAPAYSDADFRELLGLADHVILNSCSQWNRLSPLRPADAGTSLGLRVNPQHSEVKTRLYDACAPNSRLGVLRSQLEGLDRRRLDGLHFHALCESGADALERLLAAFEERFGDALSGLKWVNFGGGHHITRPDYDRDALVRLIADFRRRRGVEVYLEPGEAVALGAGVLVASVLDIVHNGMDIALLDVSATAHMPDVLEMPYRPEIDGSGAPGELAHTYRLAGTTCLAGDVIGDYSFPEPLRVGQRLLFLDMGIYTLVKSNFFNGVRHPAICVYDATQRAVRVVRRFGYEDYKGRLS
jgi:carboxynorspermidine decarboxylase